MCCTTPTKFAICLGLISYRGGQLEKWLGEWGKNKKKFAQKNWQKKKIRAKRKAKKNIFKILKKIQHKQAPPKKIRASWKSNLRPCDSGACSALTNWATEASCRALTTSSCIYTRVLPCYRLWINIKILLASH